MAITVVSYVVYGVYELLNVTQPQFAAGRFLFALATLALCIATALLLWLGVTSCSMGARAIACLVLAALCLAGLVKALFFSLPANTYAEPGARRAVCRTGLYAICRHPGVLFYTLMYLLVLAAFPTAEVAACVAVLIVGDLAYMMLQDRWSFPRIFSDYPDYRLGTPLIVPTPKSLHAWRAGSTAREAQHA